MTSDPLEDLLEQTRIALLDGDFAMLEDLARATGAALDNPAGTNPESLERIRALANGNAALIEAAARGVLAAKSRLARPESFSTYDSHGQRGAFRPDDPGRTRRL